MADKQLNIPIRVKGARKAKQELGGVDKTISKIGKSALIAGSAFLSARGLVTGLQKSIELSSKFNAVSSIQPKYKQEPLSVLTSTPSIFCIGWPTFHDPSK